MFDDRIYPDFGSMMYDAWRMYTVVKCCAHILWVPHVIMCMFQYAKLYMPVPQIQLWVHACSFSFTMASISETYRAFHTHVHFLDASSPVH